LVRIDYGCRIAICSANSSPLAANDSLALQA
jgi:hypothetical protein